MSHMRRARSSRLPRITIAIPSYNYGRFLARALNSILAQSYENLQIIVVDGASTDNTLLVLDDYKDQLDIVISERDRGQTEAINKAFRLADGDIFNWLNADDELLPGSLMSVANAWRSGADMIIGKCWIHYCLQNKSILPPIYIPDYYQYFDFVSMSFLGSLPQPAVFLSKKLANKAFPLSENLRQVMDYQLYLRCLRVNPRICLVERPLANFFYHGSNMSSSDVPMLPEFIQVCSDEIVATAGVIRRLRLRIILNASVALQNALDNLNHSRSVSKLFHFAVSNPILFLRPLWWRLFANSIIANLPYRDLSAS